MEQMNIGTIGAKRQSWSGTNPRDLLKSVMDENPGADRPVIFKLFRERLREDNESEDYVDTIIEYWLANNYYSLVGPSRSIQATTRIGAVTEAANEIRTRVASKIKESAKIVLLELVMPNGKQLRECTGKECRELSARVGEWLLHVSERVKARQTVGDVLTEADLQEIY